MSSVLYRLGYALRETGQALERVGCRMQGVNSFEEELPRLTNLTNFGSLAPEVSSKAYVAPTAALVGDVTIADDASVWYNCFVRGDLKPVEIGKGTNLQDGVTVGTLDASGHGTVVGEYVSVGHGATLSGCTIGDRCLVGMGAVVSDGCKIANESIVAAGAVVEKGTAIGRGEVWGGNPAKLLRSLKPEELEYLKTLPAGYTRLAAHHKDVLAIMYEKMDALARP